MSEFEVYSRIDRRIPQVSGAYNIVKITRDDVPVISVAYYNTKNQEWYVHRVSEYGYSEVISISDEFISYYQRIDGVKFNIIPMNFDITIVGVRIN